MSPKLPHVTSMELLRALKRAGWQPACQSGSHMTLKHPEKKDVLLFQYMPVQPLNRKHYRRS